VGEIVERPRPLGMGVQKQQYLYCFNRRDPALDESAQFFREMRIVEIGRR
jgi:hypothetical protein